MDINSYDIYRIKRESMTLIADKLRALVGKTTPLTPAEIAYYLERVIFTPQSYASSEFNLNFGSAVLGVLPEVQLGNVNSEFTLNFESNAIGILPVYEVGNAVGEFLLNFESSAIGALQEE